MTNLESLLERVKLADGPDRELDAALLRALAPDWLVKRGLLELTGSIDAAVSLVGLALPGYRWGVSCHSYRGGETYPDGKPKYVDGYRAHLTQRSALRPMPKLADAPTPSLALLCALLSTLISQEPAVNLKLTAAQRHVLLILSQLPVWSARGSDKAMCRKLVKLRLASESFGFPVGFSITPPGRAALAEKEA